MKSEIMGVATPNKNCTDKKCPFHGEVTVKKELFRGKVIKKDVSRSATIEWFKPFFVPKFERYEVRRYRMRTHNPACVNAEIGEEVLVAKTRPLSKTKNHVILQVLHAAEKVLSSASEDGLSVKPVVKESSKKESHKENHKETKKTDTHKKSKGTEQ